MKAIQTLAIVSAMSDVFRAFAGSPEAQCDMLANTVYTAAYHVMLANNKTQFNKLADDAKLYGSDSPATTKLIKSVLGLEKATPAVKHFRRTYFALSVALDQCGIPEMRADVPQGKANAKVQFDMLDQPAQDYAAEFVSVFFTTMSMPEKTEDERAEAAEKREAAKALREAEKAAVAAQEAKEQQEAIDAQVSSRVERATATEAMAQTIADMLATGALPADLEALIIEAARTRETALLLAQVAEAVPA